jgi:uncharacterized membrane protein
MWFILGLIVGLILLMALWLRGRDINIAWYSWLLMVIGLILMLFAAQNYQAAMSDFEPNAPGVFLILFGLPGLLFFALAVVLTLVVNRKKQAKVKTAHA